MRVAIGADHAGFALKEALKEHLKEKGHHVLDAGNRRHDPRDDFTDFSHGVASAVRHHLCDRGIIICATGASTCVVANKHQGIRAAECGCIDDVKQAREHLDINVMTMGGLKVPEAVAAEMVDAFLATRARHGRYARRREKIEPHVGAHTA
ncbi:MAG: RpiB/LacA/LacB family sugar-phosphate isomerase [Candidatus Aenigmarchaeota archaeon]|nr:RpiB/LacA/LacB family sugar-phosphate isomerase [Candidatus Aenigmarchaeota archaeon]